MFKKISLAILFLFCYAEAHADHRYGINATNITTGTLNSSLLDESSVTLQGNQFNGANQLIQADSSGNIPISELNGGLNASATTFFRGDGTWITPIQINNFANGQNASAGTFWRGDGIWSSIASSDSLINGLVITTVSANLDRFIITADNVIFGGNYFTNISTVILTGRLGTGGLDTGTVANLTWYSMFFITNGSTVAVIASSGNPVSPTMPSGYINSKKIGYFYVNNSGNIVCYYKNGLNGDVIFHDYSAPILNLGTGASSNEVALDLTAYIPPKTLSCNFHSVFAANAVKIDCRMQLRLPGEKGITSSQQYGYGIVIQSSTGYLQMQQQIKKNMMGYREINYQTAATDSGGLQLYLMGYSEGGL